MRRNRTVRKTAVSSAAKKRSAYTKWDQLFAAWSARSPPPGTEKTSPAGNKVPL